MINEHEQHYKKVEIDIQHDCGIQKCHSLQIKVCTFLIISLATLHSTILSNAVANDVHLGPPLLVTLSSFLNQAARHSRRHLCG